MCTKWDHSRGKKEDDNAMLAAPAPAHSRATHQPSEEKRTPEGISLAERAAGDDPMMTMAFSSVCSLFPPFPRPLFLFPFRPKSHFICLPRWRLSYWVVASSPFCREQNTKLLIGPPLSFFSSFIVPHTLGSVASEEDSHLQRAALTHFFLWTPSLVRSNRQQ